jgi:GNAT superfamily N-acetyltransferase
VKKYKTYHPDQLSFREWRSLQSIARASYTQAMPYRSVAETDELVHWNDFATYYRSRIDPNFQAQERFGANRSFYRPRVVVATESNIPIGFALSTSTTSSASNAGQLLRRFLGGSLCVQELVVHPEYQNHGVAKQLGRTTLQHALPSRPVLTYTYPEEFPGSVKKLEELGFCAVNVRQARIFGEASDPTSQVLMEAPLPLAVINNL